MELPINQDPEQLNKSVYSGLKWWQYMLMASSVAVAVVFVVIFQSKLGMTLCSIIGIVIVGPPGYVATYKKNGLNFFEYRQKKKINQTEIFVYRSAPFADNKVVAKENKGFGYIMKNLVTGGKNL